MTLIDNRPARGVGEMDLRLGARGAVARALPVPKMAGVTKPAKPIVLPALTGAPPKVIRLKVKDTTTVYVIDSSGSMYPHTSGDATGIRFAAAQSLVDLQRRYGGGMVYVLHWGSTVPEHLIAGPLDTKRDRKAIARALTIPTNLGGNDLPLALRKTHAITREAAKDGGFIYAVISDGIEDVSQATRDAVAALNGQVHMILVDRGSGCSPVREAAWNTAGFTSLTRLSTFDTRAMAHELGAIYANALGLEMANPSSTMK